jgi:hypothetical protein
MKIVSRVWLQIFADAIHAHGISGKLRALFGKPV